MYQATTSIPSLNNGRNLAPQLKADAADPVKEASKPFNEWIKETTEKLERQDREIWRELHLVWLLICLFIEGKHMLRKRHRGFGFDVIPMPDTTAAAVREQNKLGFYSRALSSKHVSSRTKIDAIAGDDTEEAQGAARMAEAYLEATQDDIYTERFRQSESLGGQVCGSYARYFHFDPNADGGYANDPVIEESQVSFGENLAQCLECGYEAPAAEFGAGVASGVAAPMGGMLPDDSGAGAGAVPEAIGAEFAGASNGFSAPTQPGNGFDQGMADAIPADGMQAGGAVCPGCGSSFVQIDEMPAATVQNVVGNRKRKLGKTCGKSVPYTRLRHEIGKSLEESPWMRWTERYRLEEIKRMWPGVKVGPADSQMRDSGLEVEDTLARTVGGYQNTAYLSYWSKDRAQYGEVTHWWLAPEMYHDYIFPVDTPTAEGATIPAGMPAINLFPNGMHFVKVSGADQPLALEDDSHRDHWVTAPYHLRFLVGLGLGINDAVEMQRQWNVVLGLVFTHIRTAALPGWLYDKDTVSPDEVRKLGQPQVSVPASLRNKPEGTRLEQLVYQMAPGQIPSHIPWYIQQLDANMQTISGALINEGVPGTDSKTATGTVEMVNASQQHNAPEFALKGDADVRSAYILCALAQKHMPENRFLAIQGKWGQYDTVQFSGADLAAGTFRLQAKRDSWLPNSRRDKQQAIEKVLMVAGGVMGLLELQNAAPDLLDQLEEAYDVTIHGDTYSANAILCRERLDQVKQLAPMFEQMAAGAMAAVDPETGMVIDPMAMLAEEVVNAIRPPIEPEEPGHLLSINCLREWFITDEGKKAGDLERACVKAMIARHIQSQILEGQITAMAQMAATPMAPADEGQGQPAKTDADKRKDSANANLNPKPKNPMAQAGGRPTPAMASA